MNESATFEIGNGRTLHLDLVFPVGATEDDVETVMDALVAHAFEVMKSNGGGCDGGGGMPTDEFYAMFDNGGPSS